MKEVPPGSSSASPSGAGDRFRDDYYELLGVSPSDEIKAVKLSYRRLVRKLHPDMAVSVQEGEALPVGDDSYLLSVLSEAHDVLSHPERRSAYNARLGLQVSEVQSSVVKQRVREDRDALVSEVRASLPVPGDLRGVWWRNARVMEWLRLVLSVVGGALSVVSAVLVFNIGWGYLFLLVPFLSLWWGYARGNNAFNVGAWVLGLLVSAGVFWRQDGWSVADGLSRVSLAWFVWGVVMGVVLFVGYNLVTPAKRVWAYARVGMGRGGVSDEVLGVTAELLGEVVALPGAIVVHNLKVDVGGQGGGEVLACEHAVIVGKKVALVNSVQVPVGDVRWDTGGRGLVVGAGTLVETDAGLVGRKMRDKELEKAGSVREFVFCHQGSGDRRGIMKSSDQFPILTVPEEGLREVMGWLMDDNSYMVTNKRLVESVWRYT